MARGEFSIAIAGIGAAAGLGERFIAIAATYVLILAVLGPIAARVADPLVAARLRRRRLGELPAR
jgi:CPA2 family monovalent cation:H+ antiporter-2